nr:hypothetical protein [uncultured Collinsella sp.]
MANANWHGGKSKGRAQAYARLRHNDNERRADPQVEHANREIDKSRTHLNFEVGPTAGLSYEQKKARLDARLNEFGYPPDSELKTLGKNAPTAMQSIVIYAPDALNDEAALADGRLRKWFEAAADELVKNVGEENVISFSVDVDEVHDYIDAATGKQVKSKFHAHAAVVPVCDVKQVARQLVYLRPDGSETLDENEAERVFIDKCNAETDDIDRAARDEHGDPITGPKCARMKNGRRKYKKQKRADAAKVTRKLSGSEFASRARMSALNAAIHKRTEREFGLKWNSHELGTYQRVDGGGNKTVEELKAASAAREIAQRVEVAEREINAAIERSDALTNDAETMRAEARKMRADARAKHAAVERQINDMLGDSYVERYVALNGSLQEEIDLDTGLPSRAPGLRAIERELDAKRREVGDLKARDDALTAREKTVAAMETSIAHREQIVVQRVADVDERERRATEREQRAEQAFERADRLIKRFIGDAIDRFAAKLESLASVAEKAASDRPRQRGLWHAVSDASGVIARHVREHSGGETMKEWADADVVNLYGKAPDLQHAFVADLWSYANVSARRAQVENIEAESWRNQARNANELASILNRIVDPVIDDWIGGDEFILEQLDEEPAVYSAHARLPNEESCVSPLAASSPTIGEPPDFDI